MTATLASRCRCPRETHPQHFAKRLSLGRIFRNRDVKELSAVGLKPVVLMVGKTAFLAALVLVLLRLAG